MTGKEIYLTYINSAWRVIPGSPEWAYVQTLQLAFFTVGPDRFHKMLEEAEKTGQKIEIVFSIGQTDGQPHATDIRLVPKAK